MERQFQLVGLGQQQFRLVELELVLEQMELGRMGAPALESAQAELAALGMELGPLELGQQHRRLGLERLGQRG